MLHMRKIVRIHVHKFKSNVFQFAMMEVVSSSFIDQFPSLHTHGRRKLVFIATLCLVFFLAGLPQCTKVLITMSMYEALVLRVTHKVIKHYFEFVLVSYGRQVFTS
jgi:hypothetical protein